MAFLWGFMGKENLSLVISIFLMFNFLIFGSILWKRLHDAYNMVDTILESDTKVLSLTNDDFLDNCCYIDVSSNYQKARYYDIVLEGFDNVSHELIYLDGHDVIYPNETHHFEIKVYGDITSSNNLSMIVQFK